MYIVGFVLALLVDSRIVFDHCSLKCVLYDALEGLCVENRAPLSGHSVVVEGWKSICAETENNNSSYIPMTLLAYHPS